MSVWNYFPLFWKLSLAPLSGTDVMADVIFICYCHSQVFELVTFFKDLLAIFVL
jgi:hypothetical protein